jgi:hypothetical protein
MTAAGANLSVRSIAMLRACAGATHTAPISGGVSFPLAHHLVEKHLLGFRGFDPKLGRGGHYITPAGLAALRAAERANPAEAARWRDRLNHERRRVVNRLGGAGWADAFARRRIAEIDAELQRLGHLELAPS